MRETLRNVTIQLRPTATEGLTPEEDGQLVELLSKWKSGRISTPVYTELARILPQPIVEVVIFRKNNGILETLLIPRPADDIVWPGMWHNPGTAIRASDFNREDKNPLNGAFERVQRNELNNSFAFTPVFVTRRYRSGERGTEIAEIYFTELSLGPDREKDVWYPVDKLAQNPYFIQGQLGHVLLAAEHYMEKEQS